MLTETDLIAAKIGPACLLECDTATSGRSFESGLTSLASGPRFDPLEECLIRQIQSLDDSLNTLRTNDLPVAATVAKLSDVLHQSELVAVLFEQPVVGLLEGYCVVPNTSRHRHQLVESVSLAYLVHSELVANSHLNVTLIFDVLLDYTQRCSTCRGYKVAIGPECRQPAFQVRKHFP